MKANKLMIAALAMGAFVLAACDNNPDKPTPVIPTPITDEVPEVSKPDEGYVTIVLQIPEGTECNGIYLKGNLGGDDWSGENTYVGLDAANVSAAEAVKFEAIEGSKKWFKATFKLGEGGLQGKICQKFENDGSWQGQAVNVSVDETNTTVTLAEISGEGQFVIEAGTPAGVLYLTIGGWQNSECQEPVDYQVTVLTPAFCDEEFDIELVGSFEGWGSAPVALTKAEAGKYTATITANANAEVKVRGVGGWDKEVQELKEDGTWGGASNVVLTDNTTVTMDYTDAAKYRWNVCAPTEEE